MKKSNLTLFKNTEQTMRLRPLALAIAMGFTTIPVTAHAATYYVYQSFDTGVGSLRDAVDKANNDTPDVHDTIEFNLPSGSVINLNSQLLITDPITITGPTTGDSSSIILDAGQTSRHIQTDFPYSTIPKILILENITLRNGRTIASAEKGGAIEQGRGDLTLNNALISHNATTANSGDGGGIYFSSSGNIIINHSSIVHNSTAGDGSGGGGIKVRFGDLSLNQSIISGNSTTGSGSRGGGLYLSQATATITQSTLSNNSTTGVFSTGGGIHIHGSAFINQSTVSNNTSHSKGGGVYSNYGALNLHQSTISNNTSQGDGGGLFIGTDGGGNTTIKQSTLVENISNNGSGGISADLTSSGMVLTTTVLSNNTGIHGNFKDRAASPTADFDMDYGLFGDPLLEITGTKSGTTQNNSPTLGQLQHNAGLTQTHKPNANSPVLNAGNNFYPTTLGFQNDQRGAGAQRIIDTTVDIGAVELQTIENNTVVPPSPNEILTRRDVARELLKVDFGSMFILPLASGDTYGDVSTGDVNADWIEIFGSQSNSDGCAFNKYCPNMVVTREQMAIIYLKTKYGAGHVPTLIGFPFFDVPPNSHNQVWISELSARSLTEGCDDDNFCPKAPVTRRWFDFLLNDLAL